MSMARTRFRIVILSPEEDIICAIDNRYTVRPGACGIDRRAVGVGALEAHPTRLCANREVGSLIN